MAYTRPWDETTPVGATTLASDIDLVFRQLKQDLRERMDSVVEDWTADPVVLKLPTSLTTQYLHHTDFKVQAGNAGYDDDNDFLSSDDYTECIVGAGLGARVLRCPLRLPVGVTVTSVSFLANRNTGVPGNMNFRFKHMAYGSPATVTTIGSVSTTANGLAVWPIAIGLPYTTVTDMVYFLTTEFADGVNSRLYGAKVVLA